MAEKQKTIKQAGATLKGKGLHTGVAVEMTFKPAPENYGYRFKRIDLENQPEIRAIVDNVTDTTRSTTVEENGAKVGTIEHVMSALYALGIDNILIEINAPETPILDGCSSISLGGSKSGKPCERLTAPYLLEILVIRLMTESVKVAVRFESSGIIILLQVES